METPAETIEEPVLISAEESKEDFPAHETEPQLFAKEDVDAAETPAPVEKPGEVDALIAAERAKKHAIALLARNIRIHNWRVAAKQRYAAAQRTRQINSAIHSRFQRETPEHKLKMAKFYADKAAGVPRAPAWAQTTKEWDDEKKTIKEYAQIEAAEKNVKEMLEKSKQMVDKQKQNRVTSASAHIVSLKPKPLVKPQGSGTIGTVGTGDIRKMSVDSVKIAATTDLDDKSPKSGLEWHSTTIAPDMLPDTKPDDSKFPILQSKHLSRPEFCNSNPFTNSAAPQYNPPHIENWFSGGMQNPAAPEPPRIDPIYVSFIQHENDTFSPVLSISHAMLEAARELHTEADLEFEFTQSSANVTDIVTNSTYRAIFAEKFHHVLHSRFTQQQKENLVTSYVPSVICAIEAEVNLKSAAALSGISVSTGAFTSGSRPTGDNLKDWLTHYGVEIPLSIANIPVVLEPTTNSPVQITFNDCGKGGSEFTDILSANVHTTKPAYTITDKRTTSANPVGFYTTGNHTFLNTKANRFAGMNNVYGSPYGNRLDNQSDISSIEDDRMISEALEAERKRTEMTVLVVYHTEARVSLCLTNPSVSIKRVVSEHPEYGFAKLFEIQTCDSKLVRQLEDMFHEVRHAGIAKSVTAVAAKSQTSVYVDPSEFLTGMKRESVPTLADDSDGEWEFLGMKPHANMSQDSQSINDFLEAAAIIIQKSKNAERDARNYVRYERKIHRYMQEEYTISSGEHADVNLRVSCATLHQTLQKHVSCDVDTVKRALKSLGLGKKRFTQPIPHQNVFGVPLRTTIGQCYYGLVSKTFEERSIAKTEELQKLYQSRTGPVALPTRNREENAALACSVGCYSSETENLITIQNTLLKMLSDTTTSTESQIKILLNLALNLAESFGKDTSNAKTNMSELLRIFSTLKDRPPGSDENTFQELVGQTYENAKEIMKQKGYELRVCKNNGVDLMLTQEMNSNRVNVSLHDDIIVKIEGIF